MSSLSKHDKKLVALGLMTRGMIHDFNNSLASIMGYADFLTSDLDERSEQYQFAVNIKLAGVQMQSLLHQIRAMTLNADDKTLTPLSVGEETTKLCHDIRTALPPSHRLEVQIDGKVDARVKLHLYQFQVLLMNLINNAIESLSADEGAMTVTLTTKKPRAKKWAGRKPNNLTILETPAHSPLLYLTIDDNGSGIEDSMLDKIFDPYFTSKMDRQAHGVGLTIVRDILEQIGAGLSIETLSGHGTQIRIAFPITAENS